MAKTTSKLKQGDDYEGFTVVEARDGYYELVRDLPGGGAPLRFSGGTEEKVKQAADSWIADQKARKDKGQLA